MKSDEIQKLSYSHWALGFGVLVLLALVCIPSWNRHRDDEKLVDAKRHAEVLGYQVFEIYGEASRNIDTTAKSSGSRSPASAEAPSIGSIGNDPWGQPYRYKILSASSAPLKVQIWSAGPNKQFETADMADSVSDEYLGDDIGIVLSMSSPIAQEQSR